MRLALDINPATAGMHRVSVVSASLVAALLFSCAFQAAGQRINASVNGRVSGAAPSTRAGTIARGPGGEQAGFTAYSTDQATAKVVTGKVQGYGQKSSLGALGEMAAPGGPSAFAPGVDFPESDFVATMPKPSYAAQSPGANGFGLHLSGGLVYGSSAFAASGTHSAAASVPATHPRTAESIMNPFTPTVEGSFGSLPSTSVGRLP